MVRRSAGLLLWRRSADGFEVLLGHMGGPLWARRDEHAWSIPKGEYGDDEAALDAARREFFEETGSRAPEGPLLDLGEVRQSGGKIVSAWAVEGDLDPASLVSNDVELEWPRGSGRTITFPEIDRAAWFDPRTARGKVITAQAEFVDRLASRIAPTSAPTP